MKKKQYISPAGHVHNICPKRVLLTNSTQVTTTTIDINTQDIDGYTVYEVETREQKDNSSIWGEGF